VWGDPATGLLVYPRKHPRKGSAPTKRNMEEQENQPERGPVNSVATLIRALEEAGVDFETDNDGNVKGSPEVIEFLESKEALHTPGVETIRTKDELLLGTEEERDGVTAEEKGYSFRQLENKGKVEDEIDKGTAELGPSEFTAKSTRHQNIELYIGPIPELLYKLCLVKRNPEDPHAVAVQFDDATMILNDRALGYGWHEFPYPHISDTRNNLDKWKDLFPDSFLVNILCEDEEHNKTIAIKATTSEEAKESALAKHKEEFPDIEIKDIEIHETTDQ